jgi:hypothetical protein
MFEEGFNLLVWGRGTMGNQARILNQYFSTYVTSCNRSYLKYILSYSFNLRFEDKLVHKILLKSKIASIPTTQIPIIPFNFPLIFKYTFWALRSALDQISMKFASRFDLNRNRLFQTQNWSKIYSDKDNKDNFNQYLKNFKDEFNYPLTYYNNRASGKSRPLSEIDLTSPAQVAILIEKIKNYNINV